MATKVYMEALSPTMEEGRLIGWQKKEGDQIKVGDVLAEIETDKATMELIARGSGVLRKILLGDGGTAPVGSVIAVIAEPDEDISGILKSVPAEARAEAAPGPAVGEEPGAAGPPAERAAGQAAAELATAGPTEPGQAAGGVRAAEESPQRQPTPAVGTAPERAAGGRVEQVTAPAEIGRLKASPLARRLAAEAGLELGQVQGTGPGGRITKRDIEAAVAAPAPAAAVPAVPAYQPPVAMAEVEEIPVTQMRKTIARRLATSIGPVPTFYLTTEVDMERMLAVREQINRRLEAQGMRVSINDLLIKAVAAALVRHPDVNASWGETVIRRYGRVHIGVAVAIEDGLITPIIRDADRKGVAQIAYEVRELAGRARERKLAPEEYTGATFSISNLGMFGIQEFTAIINPPESAILAVGTVEEKPVVEDGEVVIRSRMRLTMSCDHRVIDGAMGARFLQTLKDNLEEPTMMLA
jgi:pyruvate dehydrogenase E2 component (dihydrolipoamide acetyltransferase)